jgi:hypothetical protein
VTGHGEGERRSGKGANPDNAQLHSTSCIKELLRKSLRLWAGEIPQGKGKLYTKDVQCMDQHMDHVWFLTKDKYGNQQGRRLAGSNHDQ